MLYRQFLPQADRLVENCIDNAFNIAKDFIIPEAKNRNAFFLEHSGPSIVLPDILRVIVLASVNFNAQSDFRTIKIEYIWANRVLAAKLKLFELFSPLCSPEPAFRIGHF